MSKGSPAPCRQGPAKGSGDHNARMSRPSTFGHSVFLGEGAAASGGAPRRAPGLLAVLLWLAAGLSVGYWVLQTLGRSPLTPVAAPAVAPPAPDAASVARVLGAVQVAAVDAPAGVPPPLASRFQLLGVVAAGGADGAALIAIDGQPPKPYRVGMELDGGVVLESVQRRSVRLAPSGAGASGFELTLPEVPGESS